ncbi:MAG: lasso peptide biosynthesis B2 protein [Candidatus Marinimicrobia bacterium]|nr:lasso peptide biosynthesis B2 protein [Candidatus Neomarinimicrobiota bacterium]
MNKLKTYAKLPLKYKILLISDAIIISGLKLLRDIVAFKTLMKIMSNFSNRKVNFVPRISYSREELAWGVNLVSKYLLRDRPCLIQALVLWMQMRRRGYPAALKIGVKKDIKSSLKAHAWVESSGVILVGNLTDLNDYKVFPSVYRFQS